VERAAALRDRLSEATGSPAAFTWFLRMDPQVAETWGSPTWAAERYRDTLVGLIDCGDELGLHTHTWRWHGPTGTWVADFQDAVWAEHCVTLGLDAFKTSFGQDCTAHRGGDHFLSGAMLSALETNGVKVDLTVEPGLPPVGAAGGETALGLCPDYRGVPSRPYRSSPNTFPAPDPTTHSDPLLVPLLSARGMSRPFRRLPLYPWDPPNRFGERLAVELLVNPPPIVAIAVRSDSAISSESWGMITERLEHLARFRRMVFVTATGAAEPGRVVKAANDR
jgi:hypothetical protein